MVKAAAGRSGKLAVYRPSSAGRTALIEAAEAKWE